jgi:hypothetical protein
VDGPADNSEPGTGGDEVIVRSKKKKPTVTSIIEEVERLLATPKGQAKVKQLNGHFVRLEQSRGDLLAQRRRIRPRPGWSFYASVGNTRSTRLEIDVRMRGGSSGSVTLVPGRTQRTFKPKDTYSGCFPGQSAPWESDKVRCYLDHVQTLIPQDGAEAEVESALLLELSKTSRRSGKPPLLLLHQPVKLAKLPFQFPLPISARKEPRVAGGKNAGHADVIARARTAGRLRIRLFELKQRGAADIDHALDQAVAYCAALDHLATNHPQICGPALGFGGAMRALRLDAVAFVPDSESSRYDVHAAARRLLAGGSSFGLCGMFYTYEDGVLKITKETRYS